jgi:hypothetical protein
MIYTNFVRRLRALSGTYGDGFAILKADKRLAIIGDCAFSQMRRTVVIAGRFSGVDLNLFAAARMPGTICKTASLRRER